MASELTIAAANSLSTKMLCRLQASVLADRGYVQDFADASRVDPRLGAYGDTPSRAIVLQDVSRASAPSRRFSAGTRDEFPVKPRYELNLSITPCAKSMRSSPSVGWNEAQRNRDVLDVGSRGSRLV